MEPYQTKSIKSPLKFTSGGTKKYLKILIQTDKFDKKKLRTSFVANVVQSLDAQIVCNLFNNIDKIDHKIDIFSLHDRFFVSPLNASR